ncbi:MAG TPA: DUF2950 domain-containing protein [Xanthomonadales bacterium]|nr:DUF2950 domain-containing protein [Xanthomonadales bacterium]
MSIRSFAIALVVLATATTAPVVAAQQKFKSPEAAVEALQKAAESGDPNQFDKLLGSAYRDFHAGQQADAPLAKARLDRFAKAMKEFRSVGGEGESRIVYVGAEGWPFPVPIVRSGNGWAFDGAAGVEELRNRIVGANELNAIAVLGAYGDAQREYALEDHDGDGVIEYAQRFGSSAGAQDGLYWDDAADDPEGLRSPLGPLIALAEQAMGQRAAGEPFLGYRFRILTSQGAGGKTGAYDYVVGGNMVGGYAAIAWPAKYGDTGVQTFVVNQDAVVYQRDLGDDTEAQVQAITRFEPGDGWQAVDDDSLLGDVRTAGQPSPR